MRECLLDAVADGADAGRGFEDRLAVVHVGGGEHHVDHPVGRGEEAFDVRALRSWSIIRLISNWRAESTGGLTPPRSPGRCAGDLALSAKPRMASASGLLSIHSGPSA